MYPVVILQFGESYPFQNSKELAMSWWPVGCQHPWTASFKINLYSSCFYKKDDIPAMIKIHYFLYPVFNQSSKSDNSPYPRCFKNPTFVNPYDVHIFSHAADEIVLILFCVLGGKQGAHSWWLVSKDRRAGGLPLKLSLLPPHCLFLLYLCSEGRLPDTLLGPLLFVCLFSPSAWSGLVFSFVKNNKNIHWETFAGIISGHHSYLFSVINYNSPFPLLPCQGSWWFMVDRQWNLSEEGKISKNYRKAMEQVVVLTTKHKKFLFSIIVWQYKKKWAYQTA